MAYYQLNFDLMTHYKYSLTELENMIPWERTVYLALMDNYLREKNEEIKRQEYELSRGIR